MVTIKMVVFSQLAHLTQSMTKQTLLSLLNCVTLARAALLYSLCPTKYASSGVASTLLVLLHEKRYFSKILYGECFQIQEKNLNQSTGEFQA